MEGILSAGLYEVLVGTDTSCLKSFRGELLILIRDQVDTQWEVLNACLLATQVKDADLGVGDTPTETRLGVWLVLTVAVTETKISMNLLVFKVL